MLAQIELATDIDTDIKNKKIFKFNDRLRITYKDLKKFMNYCNYYEYRQKSSTHIIFKNNTTGHTIPIPYSPGTICQGTVSKILKQMNLTRSDLAEFLYK